MVTSVPPSLGPLAGKNFVIDGLGQVSEQREIWSHGLGQESVQIGNMDTKITESWSRQL